MEAALQATPFKRQKAETAETPETGHAAGTHKTAARVAPSPPGLDPTPTIANDEMVPPLPPPHADAQVPEQSAGESPIHTSVGDPDACPEEGSYSASEAQPYTMGPAETETRLVLKGFEQGLMTWLDNITNRVQNEVHQVAMPQLSALYQEVSTPFLQNAMEMDQQSLWNEKTSAMLHAQAMKTQSIVQAILARSSFPVGQLPQGANPSAQSYAQAQVEVEVEASGGPEPKDVLASLLTVMPEEKESSEEISSGNALFPATESAVERAAEVPHAHTPELAAHKSLAPALGDPVSSLPPPDLETSQPKLGVRSHPSRFGSRGQR